MVKIYTKTGDNGTTSLFGGKRVDKNSLRIGAYGEVDELNSLIGLIVADLADLSLRGENGQSNPYKGHSRLDRESSSEVESIDSRFPSKGGPSFGWRGNDKEFLDLHKKLLRVQGELFVLGADLATPYDVKVKVPRIFKVFVSRLEKEIDVWEKELPKIKNFILPGGGKTGAMLHLARTVARRAERSVVDLSKEEKINVNAQIYINRLSDWFFVLARYANKLERVSENIWVGRKQ